MDVDGRRELSAEALGVLKEGIGLVFSRWWALQMAVDEWGGPDSRRKVDQLASNIISWFTQPEDQLYIDDLETMLDETLLSLNTVALDDSAEEEAYNLMIMHEECLEGNFKTVESLRKVPIHHVRQVVEDDDDVDDDGGDEANGNADSWNMMPDDSSNMMLDAPESLSNSSPVDMPLNNPSPKVVTEAEDGWVQVARRRKRGGRH